MAYSGEKLLVLELVATEIIVTVRELSKGKVPTPSQYIASLVVFGVLGGVAAISESFSKMAAAFGAVTLITVIVTDPKTLPNLFNKSATIHQLPNRSATS